MKKLLILLCLLLPGVNIYSENSYTEELWAKIHSPANKDISALELDQNDNLFAAIWGQGLFQSGDNGENWAELSNGLTNLYITDIAIDQTGVMYVSTMGGGIFRSNNGGNSWSEVNSGLKSLHIKTIHINSVGKLFAGSYGRGMFMSTDGGDNWTEINERFFFQDVNAIITVDDSVVLAGTAGKGIFRSVDNGENWQRLSTYLQYPNITCFVRNSSGQIYAGSMGTGIIYSVDNGASWTPYHATPNNPKNATCMVLRIAEEPIVGTTDKGAYRYDFYFEGDDGWMRARDLNYGGINCIVRNSQGVVFAGRPYNGLIRSDNDGYNWDTISVETDNGIVLKAYSNSELFAHSIESGLMHSTNNGNTWTSVGLVNDSVYSILKVGTDWYAGTNDGVMHSSDQGENWTSKGLSGRSIHCLESAQDGSILASDTNIYRTTNQGTNWTTVALNNDESGMSPYVPVIKKAPNGWLYATVTNATLRSKDNGATWPDTLGVFDKDDVDSSSSVVLDITFNSLNDMIVSTDELVAISKDWGDSWDTFEFDYWSKDMTDILVTSRDDIIVGVKWRNEGVTPWQYHILRTSNNGVKWDTLQKGVSSSKIMDLEKTDKYLFLSTNSIYRAIEPEDLIAPLLVSPTDEMPSLPNSPTLTWNTAPRAEMYEIQIAYEQDFSILHETASTADTTWTLARALDNNKEFHWRVRSKVHSSVSEWSNAYSFATQLDAPQPLSPDSNALCREATTILFWSSVKDAEEYHVQVAKDYDFTNIIFDVEQLTDTTFAADNLEMSTSYFWRVSAASEISASDWSDIWVFSTLLAAPIAQSPADSSYGSPTTETLKWHTVPSAETYRLQISRNIDFSDNIYDGPSETDSTYLISTLEYYTTYFWRLKSENTDCESDWSDYWTFTTLIIPPSLLAPENNAYIIEAPAVLEWEPYKSATHYHLQIASDDDFNNLIISDTSLLASSYSLDEILPNSSYFWRVRYRVDSIYGEWSEIWTFNSGLAKPVLLSPANGAEGLETTIILSWEDVSGAESYQIQVALNEDFSTVLHDISDIELSNRDFYGLDKQTTFYWRVKAFNQFTESIWSDTWSFSTEDTVDAVNELFAEQVNCMIYPNPVLDKATISFTLDNSADVNIEIYSSGGLLSHIKTLGRLSAGSHSTEWTPSEIAGGAYLIKITIDNNVVFKKVILLR